MKTQAVLEPLIKFGPPTEFDIEPYLTLWKEVTNEGPPKFYLQISQEINESKWERLGCLLEIALEDLFTNRVFLIECVRLYALKKDNPLKNISKIILES